MNRFAVLVALLMVALGLSAASSFPSGASLALATVIVAAVVLAHKFVHSVQTSAGVPAAFAEVGEFVGCVVRYTLRFAFAALAIAWTLFSLRWYAA